MPMAGKSNDIAKDNSNSSNNKKEKKEKMMKKNWQKNAQNMNMNIRTGDSVVDSAMVPGKTIYSPTECATMQARIR